MIERHLAIVERDVAMGLHHIELQATIVARLQRRRGCGALAEYASQLLMAFKEMQMEHQTHRGRLLREMQQTK